MSPLMLVILVTSQAYFLVVAIAQKHLRCKEEPFIYQAFSFFVNFNVFTAMHASCTNASVLAIYARSVFSGAAFRLLIVHTDSRHFFVPLSSLATMTEAALSITLSQVH